MSIQNFPSPPITEERLSNIKSLIYKYKIGMFADLVLRDRFKVLDISQLDAYQLQSFVDIIEAKIQSTIYEVINEEMAYYRTLH